MQHNKSLLILVCLLSMNLYAQRSIRKEKLAYYSVNSNKYAVGTYNREKNVFTTWSNVFVTASQLPYTGPAGKIEYIFEKEGRPEGITRTTNTHEGVTFVGFRYPDKYFHIYGKTNLIRKVTDRPMECAADFQSKLFFGFDTGEGYFFVVSETNAPIKKMPSMRLSKWKFRYLDFPIHRSNDLEVLKRKYIKGYDKTSK